MGFEGHPEQTNFGLDGYVPAFRSAVGVNYRNDRVGQLRHDEVNITLSPKLRIGRFGYLMPAVSVNLLRLGLGGN